MSELICRIRPCDKPSPLVTVLEREARIEVGPEKGQPGEPLRFDHLIHGKGENDQGELFEVIKPHVLDWLDGTSCTILVHGGPQSGKTFSLCGFPQYAQYHGIVPRTVQLIGEEMARSPESLPSVEASFYELQQDGVFDLLPRGLPKVSLRELNQPPFLLFGSNLTVQRCDGATGPSRLLDAYYAGLEHKRKGAHICFELVVPLDNGRRRSSLRFIEMCWPRPQAGATTVPGKGATLQGPPQGRSAAALEQVLQCKLLNSSTAVTTATTAAAYRSSPLATLLKPCFEGAGHSLVFLHCLRLEQLQLPCLALAAQLLAKIFLWLCLIRGVPAPANGSHRGPGKPAALATSASMQARRHSPAVPPLRIGVGGRVVAQQSHVQQPHVQQPPHHVQPQGHHVAVQLSSGSQNIQPSWASPAAVGVSVVHVETVAQPPPYVSVPEGTVNLADETTKPPPEEAGNHADPPPEDVRILHQCSELLEARRRSGEALSQDAHRAAHMLMGLDEMLGQLMADRQNGNDTGPSEKETNLKILRERVFRCAVRTSEEMKHLRQDLEVLAHFCGQGTAPAVYDAYNATQEELEILKAHAAAQAAAIQAASDPLHLWQLPQPPQPPHPLGLIQEFHPFSSSLPQPPIPPQPPQPPQPPSPPVSKEALVVPQLPLALLPQEHPEISYHDQCADPTSPSSASSLSSDGWEQPAKVAADLSGGLLASRSSSIQSSKWPRPQVSPQINSVIRAPTPPLPATTAAQPRPLVSTTSWASPTLTMAHFDRATGTWVHQGASSPAVPPGQQLLHRTSHTTSHASLHLQATPLVRTDTPIRMSPVPPAGANNGFHGQKPQSNGISFTNGASVEVRPGVSLHQSIQRSSSGVRLFTPVLQVVRQGSGEIPTIDAVRKSASAASLGGYPGAHFAHSATPVKTAGHVPGSMLQHSPVVIAGGHNSPLQGHRTSVIAASPLRAAPRVPTAPQTTSSQATHMVVRRVMAAGRAAPTMASTKSSAQRLVGF